jgi:hypothetical protein
MSIVINYPEMHGSSDADIQAQYSLGKYRVTSKTELNESQGIRFDGLVSEFGSSHIRNKRAGYFRYYMTKYAFDKFCKTNDLTLNILLD